MELEKIGFYTLTDDRCKNASEFSQMKRCELIITEYCNFKCPYCRGLDSYIYEGRKLKQLSLDEIKTVIDLWCIPEPLENIRFSGGEPTLHKDIKDIVRYAKLKGIKRIAISTNGSNKIELYKELVSLGVNDFSISLDACCASTGDTIAGVKDSWKIVVKNIEQLSKITYVTVGVVLNNQNIKETLDIINLAASLNVSDIRVIPAAQYDNKIIDLSSLNSSVLEKYPILRYRINRYITGEKVRGMVEKDSPKCAIVLDDSAIAGGYHFPCVIYMREKGLPIGKVSSDMRKERKEWFENHNCYEDEICKTNCLDVCIHYNNRFRELKLKN